MCVCEREGERERKNHVPTPLTVVSAHLREGDYTTLCASRGRTIVCEFVCVQGRNTKTINPQHSVVSAHLRERRLHKIPHCGLWAYILIAPLGGVISMNSQRKSGLSELTWPLWFRVYEVGLELEWHHAPPAHQEPMKALDPSTLTGASLMWHVRINPYW